MARIFARPIHVAFWVDDLIFIMSTPEHSDCVGFKGGGAVCGEFYGRALKVQEMWLKARALNMPLSTKGQAIGRRGALAGLGIDTHRGRFHMLPEKLASMILGVHAHGNGEVRRRRSALWPVVPSSLYGAFLAGEQCDASNLGITFDTSVHGWAAALRTPGVEVVLWAVIGLQWTCSAQRLSTRRRSQTVWWRRCTGRRSLAFWRRAWRLVVTWAVARKSVQDILPLPLDTLKALTWDMVCSQTRARRLNWCGSLSRRATGTFSCGNDSAWPTSTRRGCRCWARSEPSLWSCSCRFRRSRCAGCMLGGLSLWASHRALLLTALASLACMRFNPVARLQVCDFGV